MTRKLTLYLCSFCCLFLVTCSSSKSSNVDITLDENTLLQGKDCTVRINNYNVDTTYHVQIRFLCNDTINWEKIQVQKLELAGKSVCAKFSIPDNAYFAEITTFKNTKYFREYSLKKEIYKIVHNDTILTENATINTMFYSGIEAVDTLFSIDSLLFPDNLSRYIIKWRIYGSSKHSTPEKMQQEVRFIAQHYAGYKNYDFVCAIGYKLIGDTTKYLQHLDKIATNNTPALNERLLVYTFLQVFKSEIAQNRIIQPVFENIMQHHPLSFYTYKLLDPILYDSRNKPSINNLIDLQLAHHPQLYYALLNFKFYYIWRNYNENYYAEMMAINDSLLYAYDNMINVFENGKNPDMMTLRSKNIYYSDVSTFYIFIGKFDESLAIKKKCYYEYLGKDDVETLLDLVGIGDVYGFKKQQDSALFYYLKAYDKKKNSSLVARQLKKMYAENHITQKYEDWVDSNYSILKSNFNNNNVKNKIRLKSLKVANGKIIEIEDLDKPLVLLFVSKQCHACRYIIQDMNKNPETKKILMEQVHFAIVSHSSVEELKDIINPEYLDYYSTSDYKSLQSMFDIVGEPVVIMIDKAGNIHSRIEGASEQWKMSEQIDL